MGDTKVEKRNRPPKSCEPCRVRKLKCNRSLPCDTCLRRSKESSCRYAPNADRNDRHENKRESVSDRLKSLENFISALARYDASSDPSNTTSAALAAPLAERQLGAGDTMIAKFARPGPDLALEAPVPITNTMGLSGGLVQDGGPATYVDSSHWSSILEDIRGIREQISSSNIQDEAPALDLSTQSLERALGSEDMASLDLTFGSVGALDMHQILDALPSRQICDSLVSHYFQSRFTTLPILHPVKFQREYEAFWQAPTNTSAIWVGLLFGVLSLGAGLFKLYNANAAAQHLMPSADALSRKLEQCLVLGRYTTAEEHSLEALMVHIQGCFIRLQDSDVSLWFVMGVAVRLALRRGYHRDPARLPNSQLSPFAGEMRRRVWISIFQVDALMSFQMGLPSMIPADYCDTELPRNLENSDFCPETAMLPSPRPFSDYTPILYTIAKNPVVAMFKAVVGHTQSLRLPPYADTLELDAAVRAAYDGMPDILKYRPLGRSVTDSAGVIMNRATVEILHLKSLIVLHRQYIKKSRHDARYDLSRRACLEAALCALDRQAELHRATQPGSQLYGDRWMGSALTTNDFILAGMVVCLELTIRTRQSAVSTTNDPGATRLLAAMRVSHEIWVEARTFSAEARIASHALEATVSRVNAHMNIAPECSISHDSQATMSQPDFESRLDSVSLEQAPRESDGMEYIDWGLLDGRFQDVNGEDLDLDSWLLDVAGTVDSSITL